MKYCTECGSQVIADETKFCPSCGQPVKGRAESQTLFAPADPAAEPSVVAETSHSSGRWLWLSGFALLAVVATVVISISVTRSQNRIPALEEPSKPVEVVENQPTPAPSGLMQPTTGSAEWTALLQAARDESGHEGEYVVHEMYIKDDYAVGIITPKGDSYSPYSDVHVWAREDGVWGCLVAGGDIGESDDPAGDIRAALMDAGLPEELVEALRFE